MFGSRTGSIVFRCGKGSTVCPAEGLAYIWTCEGFGEDPVWL